MTHMGSLGHQLEIPRPIVSPILVPMMHDFMPPDYALGDPLHDKMAAPLPAARTAGASELLADIDFDVSRRVKAFRADLRKNAAAIAWQAKSAAIRTLAFARMTLRHLTTALLRGTGQRFLPYHLGPAIAAESRGSGVALTSPTGRAALHDVPMASPPGLDRASGMAPNTGLRGNELRGSAVRTLIMRILSASAANLNGQGSARASAFGALLKVHNIQLSNKALEVQL